MLRKLVTTFEDSHMFLALLTVLAGIGGVFGLHMDPVKVEAVLLPAIVAIGAHGFRAGNAKQIAISVGQLLERLAPALAPAIASTLAALNDAPPLPPAPPAPPASTAAAPRGAARIGVLVTIALGLAVVNVVSFVGCSPGVRTTTINTTFATLDAARASLDAYAKSHEDIIVQGSTSLADGQAKLAAFRTDVHKVNADIDTGYKLAGAAAAANDSGSLTTLSNAVQLVAHELAAVEKGLHP